MFIRLTCQSLANGCLCDDAPNAGGEVLTGRKVMNRPARDCTCRTCAPIAATAIVHGMTVVTRHIADFEATGVRLVNPYAGGR